ncbi:hypothetical protein [Malaciobacter mytili]|uniref:Uncharacterized protein n=1 Tax=Malaciobacter mytili LMG 24559 TaxID=1032238 RepID=A0AAX2ADB2_9BACT|nr:hypothetical protein [Malaciobacter mytili]AXH15012.1 hypothetical protein AMYT_1431 [Malaciobacter mytili LMG 24559]RXI43498.1 hypothetical protein CRU99_07420 [Malaciobacter mytili]RXK15024.1 hypothetical protein CP985_10810 [Malaciobacter mytili LMG 24559]
MQTVDVNNSNNAVVTVVNLIKKENNFEKAAQILIENNISITQLVGRTFRLSMFDVAKLSDAIIILKKR